MKNSIIVLLVGVLGVVFFISKSTTGDLSNEIIKPITNPTGSYLQFEVNHPINKKFPSSMYSKSDFDVLKAIYQGKITYEDGNLFITEKLNLPSNMWSTISNILEVVGGILLLLSSILAVVFIFGLIKDRDFDQILLVIFSLAVVGWSLGIQGISIWCAEKPGAGRYTTKKVWVDNCTDQNVTIWVNDIKRAYIPNKSRLAVPVEFINSNKNTASVKIMVDFKVIQQITILKPSKNLAILNLGKNNSYRYKTKSYRKKNF